MTILEQPVSTDAAERVFRRGDDSAVLRISEADAEMVETLDIDPMSDEPMIVNMGPVHPSTHGVLRVVMKLDGEKVVDLDPVLGRNGVPEKFHGDGSDVVTDEALKFIRKQVAAGKPFLTVVWFGSPHVPHEALPADKALYAALPEKAQNYYGEITGIDRNVGKLRAARQGQFMIEDRDSNNPHIKKVRVVSTLEYYLID